MIKKRYILRTIFIALGAILVLAGTFVAEHYYRWHICNLISYDGEEHSFGIHVAKLAGMPASIIERATHILADLEQASKNGDLTKPIEHIGETREGMQLSFFQLDDPVLSQIRDEILGLDVNNLTPLEALNKLNDIKKIVSGK